MVWAWPQLFVDGVVWVGPKEEGSQARQGDDGPLGPRKNYLVIWGLSGMKTPTSSLKESH